MQLLKQSTAKTFRIGPFVDSTDGATAETALSIGQADIQISKAGAAFAQTSASPTTTHDSDGWYQCPLTTTDTGTVGTLTVQVTMTGALPVWQHFSVVPATIYDALVSDSGAGIKTNITSDTGGSVLQSTTISGTPASQTQFVLADGSEDDDAYNGMLCVITNASTAEKKCIGRINDYTGASKTVDLESDPGIFTIANTDKVDIIVQANHITLVDTVTDNTDMVEDATIKAQCGLALDDYDPPTDTEMDDQFAALTNLASGDILTQVKQGLQDYHLDHLLSAPYNPAAKPGSSTALFNDLIVASGSNSRFSELALSLAPGGGGGSGDSILLVNTTIDTLASQVSFTLAAGSDQNDVYNNRLIIVTDAADATLKAIGRISDYVGDTKTVTLSADPGIFDMEATDTVDILAVSSMTPTEYSAELTTQLAAQEDVSAAEVNTEVAAALATYTVPTLAETTAAISHPAKLISTTITELTTQTSFKLTAGSTDDDAYNEQLAVIVDASTSTQIAVSKVSDYDGGTKIVTLASTPVFTIADTDNITIMAASDFSALLTSFQQINAVTNTPVGEVSGFPTEIVTGDAYTVANGREIKMYFKDTAGDTLTSFGSKVPSDSDFTWFIRFTPESTPDAAASVEIAGDETDWDVTDASEPYLIIELPSNDTDDLSVTTGDLVQPYLWQLILQWGGDDSHELTTVTDGSVSVRRKLLPE